MFHLVLVHLTCLATGDSAKDDLQCFVDTLLRTPEGLSDSCELFLHQEISLVLFTVYIIVVHYCLLVCCF